MRIIVILLSLAALLQSVPAAAQDLSAEYVALLDRADSLIKTSDWEGAENCFMDAMRRHPANPMNVLVMSNVGLMRHYSGRDSLALEILDQAVAIAPAAVTVRSNRAKVLTALGRLDKAVDDYTEILRLDSMLIEPRHLRCMINMSRGRFEYAEADGDFLVRHFPEATETAESNAFVLMAASKYREAISFLNHLIQKQPTATNYGERAFCHLKLDNLNEASADINDAIRLDPANGDLLLYRAILNKKRYRPRDAADDAAQAIKLGVSPEKVRQFGL